MSDSRSCSEVAQGRLSNKLQWLFYLNIYYRTRVCENNSLIEVKTVLPWGEVNLLLDKDSLRNSSVGRCETSKAAASENSVLQKKKKKVAEFQLAGRSEENLLLSVVFQQTSIEKAEETESLRTSSVVVV